MHTTYMYLCSHKTSPSPIIAADILNNLGDVYYEQNRGQEAINNYKQAIEIYANPFTENNEKHIDTIDKLGILYTNQKNFSEAINTFQQAQAIYAQNKEKYSREYANTRSNIYLIRIYWICICSVTIA